MVPSRTSNTIFSALAQFADIEASKLAGADQVPRNGVS